MHQHIGRPARDQITGFEGLVLGRTEYLTGCAQFYLQPQTLDDKGEPREGRWFDEQRLVFDLRADSRMVLDNGGREGADIAPPRGRSASPLPPRL